MICCSKSCLLMRCTLYGYYVSAGAFFYNFWQILILIWKGWIYCNKSGTCHSVLCCRRGSYFWCFNRIFWGREYVSNAAFDWQEWVEREKREILRRKERKEKLLSRKSFRYPSKNHLQWNSTSFVLKIIQSLLWQEKISVLWERKERAQFSSSKIH